MPDIDRTADVKVSAGREPVTAEIPLAGHASEHWLELFRLFAKKLQPSHLEASDRDDRTWVIVTLPPAGQVPDSGSGVGAGCRECFDRRGQRHGAEVAVCRCANRSCCPRLVGASATVAAIPPLALTCCLKGRFSHGRVAATRQMNAQYAVAVQARSRAGGVLGAVHAQVRGARRRAEVAAVEHRAPGCLVPGEVRTRGARAGH